MSQEKQYDIIDRAVKQAISNGWTEGEKLLIEGNIDPLLASFNNVIFNPGFARAYFGENIVDLSKIIDEKTGNTDCPMWIASQFIILEFLQQVREDRAYEYIEQFLS